MDDFKTFLKTSFPGARFRSQDLKIAAKYFAKSPDKALEYLQKQLAKFGSAPPNFRPPVKCNILYSSRDFKEWPLIQLSQSIQSYIYSVDFETFKSWGGDEYPKKLQAQSEHIKWFSETGVDHLDLATGYAQYLNSIFKKTISIYNGVIKKVENKNKKKKEKFGDDFVPESAFDEAGKLKQPPGLNGNIYCCQQSRFQLLTKKVMDEFNIDIEDLPQDALNSDVIPSFGYLDRLKIAKGQPGYIPEWQRETINPSKKVRRYWATNHEKIRNAIPLVVFIGDDWVIIDGRGLLRDARRRKLADKNTTIEQLLEMVSNDPVIDSTRGIATLSYVEGVVPVRSFIPIGEKKGREYLEKSTQKESVTLLSVDIGQINPVSCGVYKVSNGCSKIDFLDKFFLDKKHLDAIQKYRTLQDSLEASIVNEALDEIDPSFKKEYQNINSQTSNDVKKSLCTEYNIDPEAISWQDITAHSTLISDYLIDNNITNDVYRTVNKAKYKTNDFGWYKKFSAKLSKEAREALNEKIWELKIASSKYKKLSVRKKEIARTIANDCVKRAETYGDNVVVAMESLTKNNKVMSGRGKRDPGWHNLGQAKVENRWFIQAISSAFEDKATHHGTPVLKVNPAYTSQTCPSCGHCSKDNRSSKDRTIFVCKSCGEKFNADLDVATYNIAHVAFSGKKLSPPSEKSSATKKPRSARKSKKSRKS